MVLQSSGPAEPEMLKLFGTLGVSGAFVVIAWLILKFRPWDNSNKKISSDSGEELNTKLKEFDKKLDDRDQDQRDFERKLEQRMASLESRVDILWGFLMRRSISEGLAAGTLVRESPLRASVHILARHDEVLNGIKVWYDAEAKGMSDLELFIELERRFSVELHALCEKEKMMDGACLAALLFILRPDAPMFKQYDRASWQEVENK